MGFLFPLFLVAGLSLVIPILIHLFNLRRYKRVYFPDIKFLQQVQLSTKRQSKIQNWKLLLSRLLFLAALVLAFSQPFLGGSQNISQKNIYAIYIDNSYSMSVADGQQNFLIHAKQKANALVESLPSTSRFIILHNSKTAPGKPVFKEEAFAQIEDIVLHAQPNTIRQILRNIHAAQVNEADKDWNIYLFTDLQRNTLVDSEKEKFSENLNNIYIYPISSSQVTNLYIDTAYFLSSQLNAHQSNSVVVEVKQSGKVNKQHQANLQIDINGQVRAVSQIEGAIEDKWRDTLEVQLSDNGWQKITITLQDHPVSFDDTFRIAARSVPGLKILTLSETVAIHPYLQAAFQTYEGFQVRHANIHSIKSEELLGYHLIILQNITNINAASIEILTQAMENGQNVLLFPDQKMVISAFNEMIHSLGDIKLAHPDTSMQRVTSIQSSHPIFQDVFEQIPDNVELPHSRFRFPITAALNTHQQSLMNFRDGKPFLAQYSLLNGKLFLCASPLDEKYTNFPVSYYFLPTIYKIAIQQGSGNLYSLNIGSQDAVWLSTQKQSMSRSVWKMFNDDIEIIPSQKPSGTGVEIWGGSSVTQAGFYHLHNETSKDSFMLAFNIARFESELDYATKQEFEELFPEVNIVWLNEKAIIQSGWESSSSMFPIWKMAIILALLSLSVETILLLQNKKKK